MRWTTERESDTDLVQSLWFLIYGSPRSESVTTYCRPPMYGVEGGGTHPVETSHEI